jgi:DNA-directed RNA polymerase II subunit RPB2
MSDEEHFKMIHTYFQENTLVNHHISSVNQFYNDGIPKVFRDMNPIKYYSVYDDKLKKYRYETHIYIGGKDVDKIYYGKPVIFDENNKHYMFPNEARLRNMTYGISIHYDVDVELFVNDTDEPVLLRKTLPLADHFFLGLFPIMLRSDLCILNKLPKETRYSMGECNHDYGGYFIIDGKEKVLVPQEKFSNNMIYIRTVNDNVHDFSVEIRSVSENTSKPQRTFAIRRVAPSSTYTNGQIMVFIPNVRKSVPLFIVFRALGIISDKDICKMIVSDIDVYSNYVASLMPCVHDAGGIFNQTNALEYIMSFTKVKTVHESYNILINYLLPHIGEMNFKAKAHFIGHMVFEMLKVIHNDEKVTDRDNFKYKRVDSSGYLMKELFIEYSNIMYENVYKKIDKEFYYHTAEYVDSGPVTETSTYLSLFSEEHFTERYVEKKKEK